MLGTMLYTRKPISFIRTDKPLQAIVWATIMAGTAKLLVMLLLFRTLQSNDPADVLQFISSGFLGNRSFAAGFTIPLGLVLHYAIVFSLVWFLWVLYPLTPDIGRWKWAAGAVYGLLIWCFIVLVMLPLSHAPQQAFSTEFNGYLLATDILLVGIPMAWVIGRYYDEREKKIAHARELFDPSSIYY